MKVAVLLDTSAIMYRAFYANLNFRTKNEPTGAVYGFVNTLLRVIKDFKPDYIGAAFDVSRSSLKRTELYKEYKAARDSAPEDLVTQIPRIEELLDCFGIDRYKYPGHEADDVIGTLAKQLSNLNYKVYVITGDKDLAQIIDSNISIALLGKGEGSDAFKIVSSDADVIEYLGVKAADIPDLFGLIGDSSDGIPGVRKIGPKKAVPMLEKYGNLEGIYENIDKLTELPGIGKSLIQNLIEDKELAFLSRTLATIEANIPEIDISQKELVNHRSNEKLKALFETLELKSMIKKMNLENEVATPHTKPYENDFNTLDNTVVPVEKEENKIVVIPEPTRIDLTTYPTSVVLSSEALSAYFDEIKKCGIVYLYTSTSGISIALENSNIYIPLKHSGIFSSNYTGSIFDFFKSLEGLGVKLVGYNIKQLFSFGVSYKKELILLDSLIGNHLLTSSTKDDIESFVKTHLDIEMPKFEELYKKTTLEGMDSSEISSFLGDRSRVVRHTSEYILARIKNEELDKVMYSIEIPLIEVLHSMESNGIKIDTDYFYKLSRELTSKLHEVNEKIYLIAGHGERKEFNLNSPKQLGEILFIDLGLPIIEKNKSGPSTNVDVLETLRSMNFEIAELILENRKLSKLIQTYIDPLPKLVDSMSRLHSSFNQIGTVTGRLSSINPNLQNIPVKSEEGVRIRGGFVAEAGKKILGIDYSQIELRVLAEMTGDKNLVRAYSHNEDLHTLTARKIFGIGEQDEVTKLQRTIAKTINFSVIYGKTPFGLSKEMGISVKEATTYINAYFEQYPAVKHFEREVITFAEENNFVRTYFGRKRYIDGINSKNKTLKSAADRMALNSVVQGSAAEIIKKAMIDIYAVIRDKSDIRLTLQVHDELIFEVDESAVLMYKEMIENIMRNAVKFSKIHLDVNGEVGDNWAETK